MRDGDVRETARLGGASSRSSGSSNSWSGTALVSFHLGTKKGGHLKVPPGQTSSGELASRGCASL